MHYDPLRLGPCPKDLSEWTSLPHHHNITTHYNTKQHNNSCHTRIRVFISTAAPQHPARASDEKNPAQAHAHGESPATNHGASQRLPPRIPSPTVTHTNMLVCPSPRPALNDPTTTSGRRIQIIHCLIFSLVADIQPSTKYKYMF